MLKAIRYLSERLQCIENKEHDLKDILEGQTTIDEIILLRIQMIYI